VASRIGIGVSVLASWMRAAGVDKDGPLCESDSREWRANPDSAPGWLRPKLLATCKARKQRNLSRRQAGTGRAEQHREDMYTACGLVCELLRDHVLSGRAKFAHRAAEWQARITGGKSVSYALTRKPGRSGVYLTTAWATPVETFGVTAGTADGEVLAAGPVVAVDLNDGHLAIRRLDAHGNPGR
jgi:hypothetical protein